MPRLIDADALMRQLEKKRSEPGKQRYTEGFNDALMRFRSMIHSAHTIEARPVRHGRWRSKGLAELECTICKYIDVSKRYSNYCPNCGNPMDGGVRND